MCALIMLVVCLYSHTIATTLSSKLHNESFTESADVFATDPTILVTDELLDQFPFESETEENVDWPISDTFSTVSWYEEWPTQWQNPEYFPFYSKIEDRRSLSDRLMETYNKHILPYSGNNAFKIAINVSLVAVGEIDEIEEKLSTVLWLTYQWNDENIKWDQDENHISDVTFGWIEVWKPVLRVDNPHADSSNRQTSDRSFDSVIYNCTGSAWFDEMMVTRTTCDLDMTYYPFDVQTCFIKLSIVGASKFPFNFKIQLDEYLSSSDLKHGSWELIYKNTTTTFGRFQIKLKFERRPLFILLNILLPIIVLALLTPTVFVLPKKSGERVGFSITMLLAISVYMTIVSDHLPQNSEPMPRILIMMFVWYILDAVIVLIVIVNSRINRTKRSTPFPSCLRKFVFVTHKILYSRTKQATETGSIGETQKCIDKEKSDEKESANKKFQDTQPQEEINNEKFMEVTWQDLSHCVDRWCFVVCYLIKVLLPVTFFLTIKSQSTMQM